MTLANLKTEHESLKSPRVGTADFLLARKTPIDNHPNHSIDSHLKFRLDYQEILLSTHHLWETITVPTSNVTPMPNMHPVVLGLMNHRSQVLWVIDLALLIGLPVPYADDRECHMVVLKLDGNLFGLRVDAIEGLLSVASRQIIDTPNHFPARLMPFLQGCVWQGDALQLVLKAEALLHAPALQPEWRFEQDSACCF